METKRHGTAISAATGLRGPLQPLQRFYCRSCRRTFTFGRRRAARGASFSSEVALEATRLYIQALASYRVLSVVLQERLGRTISRMTLNRFVEEAGSQAKTPLQVSRELGPRWSGFLGIDGKEIRVGSDREALLLAVDQGTQDVVHAVVVPHEKPQHLVRLVTEAVAEGGYPLRGLVSDLSPGWPEAMRDYFGLLPFQACRIHFDRRLDLDIAKAKRSPEAPLHAELKARIRGVLYAGSLRDACQKWYALSDERRRFQDLGRHRSFRSLERNFGLYMTPSPSRRPACRQQHHRERDQAARQETPAHGGVRIPCLSRPLRSLAGRLLPLQALHRLLEGRPEWEGSPGAGGGVS